MTPPTLTASVRYAFGGIGALLTRQHNARLLALLTALMVLTGLLVECTTEEWLWLVLACGLVWIAEALNTAIETLSDAVSTAPNPIVDRARAIAAGAVLLGALTALLIGGVIFTPRLIKQYQQVFPPPQPPAIPAPRHTDLHI